MTGESFSPLTPAYLQFQSLRVSPPTTLEIDAPAASPSLCSRAVRAELMRVHRFPRRPRALPLNVRRPRRSYPPVTGHVSRFGIMPAACSLSIPFPCSHGYGGIVNACAAHAPVPHRSVTTLPIRYSFMLTLRLRWHVSHLAEINETINLVYSQDQGYS